MASRRRSLAIPLALGVALALALAPLARADTLGELNPPGEPLIPLDAHALALGGASEARWDLKSGLPSNPAQLAGLNGVTFATVLQVRRASRNIGGEAWSETRQNFPAFQFSAGLPGGLSFGAGFRADLRSRGEFDLPQQVGDIVYIAEYSQEGGLHRFPLSLASTFGERLRLGAGLVLVRGNRSQEWFFDFENPDLSGDADLGYQDRRIRRKAEWHGTGLVLGLQARPVDAVGASLRWESGADLRGEDRIEAAGEETDEDVSLSGRLPDRLAVGLAGPLPWGGRASAQWERTAWSEFVSPLAPVGLFDVDVLSVGAEWSIGRGKARAWRERRRVPFRLGLRLANLPQRDVQSGSEVNERTFSLGTGLNIQAGRGAVDLAIFWRQLSSDGAPTENRWGLALSLRTSELWQKRTQPF